MSEAQKEMFMELTLLIGIILLITYFGLIYYAARGGNLMVGFLIMAIIWTALSILGGELTWDGAMTNIFQGGPESWGATAVNVIFGSWFGRVLVDTGIAAKLIRSVTELGGDNPVIVTILLSIVTGIIFTSTFGAGAVVAIGIIVLPILMSLGVSKILAVTTYLMSVGSGMYINTVLFSQMQAIFPDMPYDGNYLRWAFPAMFIQLFFVALMVFFNSRRKKRKKRKAWALKVDNTESDDDGIPGIAMITPIIPTTLSIAFGWLTIPAFIVGALFGLAITGHFTSYTAATRKISSTFFDGVIDVASLLGFLFILPMFNRIAGVAAPFFEPILGSILPTTTIGLVLVFIVLAPAGLFRGPLTIFGAGAATVGVINAIGSFATPFLFTLMYVPTISMNLSACPTQSWNLWALDYSKVSVKDFMKTGLIWAWLISAANLLLVYLNFG